MQNKTGQPEHWLAEIDFWCLDELQLFVVDAQNRVLSASSVIGWRTLVAQRPRHHHNFWFPFVVLAGQDVTAYVHARCRLYLLCYGCPVRGAGADIRAGVSV